MRNFKTNLIRRLARPRSKALIGRVSGGYSVSSKQNDGYVPVHDHAGQLVRPSILCIPAVPPGEDSVMDNEWAMYVDPSEAVDGEEPQPDGGGGGIDEDELWAILRDTGSETIAKNHLPSDVVYTEDIQDLGGGAVWYGQISSSGVVTKRGGTATLRVTHTTTGTYTISGLTAANVATVTPMYVASGSISPVQTAHSAVIVRSMASLTVHMFDKNGDKADYGFYLMAM